MIERNPDNMSPRARKLHDWFIRVTDPLFPIEEGEEYVHFWFRKSTWTSFLLFPLLGANLALLYRIFTK